MWHADAEGHDNYGDKVKVETEKDDGLKTKKILIGRAGM